MLDKTIITYSETAKVLKVNQICVKYHQPMRVAFDKEVQIMVQVNFSI